VTMARFAILALMAAVVQDPPPSDPPKVAVKESGDFRLLVKELEIKYGGRIKFAGKIPAKDVSVSIPEAGFYEALDALCRAHQEATYFIPHVEDWTEREHVTVVPGAWVEYPSCYSGHFKVAVASMAREVRVGPEGESQRAMAGLVFFAPPWMSVSWSSGAEVEWMVDEAKDAEGRDVLDAKLGSPDGRYQMDISPQSPGNHTGHAVRLLDFDVSKGLSSIAGKVKARVLESKVERMEVKAGATVACAKGTLKVVSVTELKPEEAEEEGEGSKGVRVVVRFEPKAGVKLDGLETILEPRVRLDSEWSDWGYLKTKDLAFEIEMSRPDRIPKWFELKLRGAERLCEVPFRIKDVVIKGKP
jgi:hypothetical protein